MTSLKQSIASLIGFIHIIVAVALLMIALDDQLLPILYNSASLAVGYTLLIVAFFIEGLILFWIGFD